MSELCFECGQPARERHHVVPRSRGGTKTVWLCCECHGKVHGMKRLDVRQLTKEGIARKRASGKSWGCPPIISRETDQLILDLRSQGLSMLAIAERLNTENVPTAKGGAQWYAATIRVVLVRRGVK